MRRYTLRSINGLDRKTQVSGILFNDFQFELKGPRVGTTWEITDGASYEHTVAEGATVESLRIVSLKNFR